MEQRGRLRNWNDDKGFGFIQPEQGGAELFAHISAMRGDRRPVAGDQVLYVAGQDAQGRARAEHIRLAGELALDRPAIRRKPRADKPLIKSAAKPANKPKIRTKCSHDSGPIQHLPAKMALLILLCVLPLLGGWRVLTQFGVVWVLLAYPLASMISFVQYWHDKSSAQAGRWRTPENVLHGVALLGGWPGALVAQQCFRHKTRKASFQLVFWSIVLAHQVVWIDWLLLDGHSLMAVLHALNR